MNLPKSSRSATSFTFYDEDKAALDKIMREQGLTQSEAMRYALRNFVNPGGTSASDVKGRHHAPGYVADPTTDKKVFNILFSPGDVTLIEEIMTSLNVRKSEAIRTAVRVYAALLKK